MKPKIALVVQRYGIEVNGGSEYSCRLIAERLSQFYEVEVLTTKALDYMTWENHYTVDQELINDVTVRRFSNAHPRNVKEFNQYSEYIYPNKTRTLDEEIEWMRKQGPVSYDLLRYIRGHSHDYKAFIFFTYTYFTTFYGLQMVPEKSIVVPTAHDEPPIYLSMFKPFFNIPRHIIYLTEEEKSFVNKLFHNDHVPSTIAGVGVDVPKKYLSNAEFREKYSIHGQYVIYVGRIDESKGCKELFEYFLRYTKEGGEKLTLILVGKAVMSIPMSDHIISLGFVTEEEKFGAIAGANCLIMPSQYESLSIVVLESFSLRKPVLVNEKCEVLKGHTLKSNAGLYYSDYEEFKACLNLLNDEREMNQIMGDNGLFYINTFFNWTNIIRKFKDVIDSI
jgi:glycosyltransferase involved in cell wall biosynthesis